MSIVRFLLILHAVVFCVWTCSVFGAEVPDAVRIREWKNKADQVNAVLWKRFVTADGIMLDYVGLDGEIVLPTPDECERSVPNALGWWTPIENGGFFNGLYLISQCERCERNDTPENQEKVRKLVRGLYKLQDVGQTPGFIARGVGADGKCHYAASSDDQNFPFILGLWRFWKSGLPTPEERAECRERLVRHIETIRKNDWLIVGDRPGFVRADWMNDTGYHCAAHLIMTVRIMTELTDDPFWPDFYRRLLDENDPKGKVRRVNILNGPSDMAGWSAWFYSGCQYAVRELERSETDPALKKIYRESLRNVARSAKPLIKSAEKYEGPKEFTPDWHRMMPPYRPQANSDEAAKLAMEQYPVWCRACPAIQHEKATLKPALCAAWIVALSDDKELLAAALPEIDAALRCVEPTELYYATFFFAENLVRFLEE